MPRQPGTYPTPDYSGSSRAQRAAVYAPAALTGNVALVYTAPTAGQVQVRGTYLYLDPGAATRLVDMPPEADSTGVPLVLGNAASTGSGYLVLRSSTGALLGIQLARGETAEFACWDTTTGWRQMPGRLATGIVRGRRYVAFDADFTGVPAQALPIGLTTQDTSPAGAPTLDYVVDQAGGVYRLGLAATNEAEAITVYGGDNEIVDTAKGFYFEARVRFTPDVTGGAATPAAGDKCVIGVGSDRNATLDNMTRNAWFLIGGAADLVLRVEADDNTTDVDDTTTTLTIVAGTYYVLAIDMTDPATGPRFYVDGVLRNTLSTVITWTGNVQPFIENAKAAALNKDNRLDIDYLYLESVR